MLRAHGPPVWQLQQLTELEQEKEVLLQGLHMMARGRDWYRQQLQRVQERQRRLGQSRASAVSDLPSPPPRGPGPPCSAHSGCPRIQGAGSPLPHTGTLA